MGVTRPWCWSEAERAQWMADQVRCRQAAGTVPTRFDADAMASALDALVDWIEFETDPDAALKATFLAAVRELGPYESPEVVGVSLKDVIHWRTTDLRFEGRMIDAVAVWRDSLPEIPPPPEPEPGRHGITPTFNAGCRCFACEDAHHIATVATARLAEMHGGK